MIPVLCKLNMSLGRSGGNKSDVNLKPSNRIKWDKVNRERYIRLLDGPLQSLDINGATVSTLGNAVIKLNRIISECAKEAAPKGVERPRRAELLSWSPQVQEAVKFKKKRTMNGSVLVDRMIGLTVLLSIKKQTTKLLSRCGE